MDAIIFGRLFKSSNGISSYFTEIEFTFKTLHLYSTWCAIRIPVVIR